MKNAQHIQYILVRTSIKEFIRNCTTYKYILIHRFWMFLKESTATYELYIVTPMLKYFFNQKCNKNTVYWYADNERLFIHNFSTYIVYNGTQLLKVVIRHCNTHTINIFFFLYLLILWIWSYLSYNLFALWVIIIILF